MVRTVSFGPVHKPWCWIPSLWFSMGLIYALSTNVSELLLRDAGLTTVQAVACASLLCVPYIVKALYAPIVEMHRTKRFFVVVTQSILSIALLLLAALLVLWPNQVIVLILFLGAIATIGSVQDIACDGTYLTELDRHGQGLFSGVQSVSWNGAALVGGGVLIAISGSGRYGWSIALVFCALLYAMAAIWHLKTMPLGISAKGSSGEPTQILAALPSFFRRPHFWPSMALCIGFPVTIGLIDKIEPFFFIDSTAAGGLGLDREILGSFYTTAGFGGLILGSVLGSVAMARRSLPQLMVPVGLGMMTPAAIYLLMASLPSVSPALAAAAFLLARASQAFGMIGYMVYLQRALSPGPFPITHFNLATALKALTMMLTGMASGQIQHVLGYRGFFAFALGCGLPLLAMCGNRRTSRATDEQWSNRPERL